MSRTNESGHDDQLLVRYVLGLLPARVTDRLDEASIADDEVASRLRRVENDLVDSYVRNRLTGETLERFESYYLASPRRRERVGFAATFVRAVDQAAARADAGTEDHGAPVSSPEGDDHASDASERDRQSPSSKLAWKFAAAAAVLVLVSGTLLLTTGRSGNRPSLAQRDSVAPVGRGRALGPANDQRAVTTPGANEPERARAASPSSVPPTMALVLQPQTRAIAAIPTLAIPSGADVVQVDLRLESNEFSRYQAGLRDPATHQILWRSGWIAAASSAPQSSIPVAVPANVLEPQHYTLDLTGRDAAGSGQVVGSYAFRVLPR